jgi:hypothetical protein
MVVRPDGRKFKPRKWSGSITPPFVEHSKFKNGNTTLHRYRNTFSTFGPDAEH